MDTRQRLLDTALNLFVANGFEGTGTQEICDISLITKPSLYHHFGSKTGLLEALLEREFEPLTLRFAEITRYEHDLTKSLFTVSRGFLDFFRSRKQTARLLLQLRHSPNNSEAFKKFDSYNKTLEENIAGLFEAAVRDHGNMKNRHTRYAWLFTGFLMTCLRLDVNNELTLDDRTLRDLLHYFSHGIYS